MSTAAIIIVFKKSGLEEQKDKNYAAITMVIINAAYFITSLPMLVVQVIIGNQNLEEQAQRRAAMDRRMHCIIPNEPYNINHNTLYIFMT